MRHTFTIGRWDIEFSTRSRRSIREGLLRFPNDAGAHWIFGCISVLIEDWTAEVFHVCAECDGGELTGVPCGYDDCLTACTSCRTVEGATRYVNKREYEAMQ